MFASQYVWRSWPEMASTSRPASDAPAFEYEKAFPGACLDQLFAW